MLGSILFTIFFLGASYLFTRNVMKVRRNILLGREVDLGGKISERLSVMARVALGQSKMMVRPVAGVMHVLIYLGFIIINIEMAEIIIDGIAGTHRIFTQFLPLGLYNFLIGAFEMLAAGVLLACVVFLARRNILRLKRFGSKEMTTWPKSDANIILVTEILLMCAFLTMNCSDGILQERGAEHYVRAGAFPISSLYASLLSGFSVEGLTIIERSCWWFHILVILAFINYIPYSKHFHIFLAFPNTYYSNLEPKGEFTNLHAVTEEVKLMLDPSAVPTAIDPGAPPKRFGAKDVRDLTWKNLLDAYSCTECGRCTSVCPANQTGKLLSPRKIMMDTRDRLEEVGGNIDKHGVGHDDGKTLLNDYISSEELWACTTCNACTDACPVNIDPLSIIVDLRRYLVMEQSAAPVGLNNMFSNIENNGAPWQFSPADRGNWVNDEK